MRDLARLRALSGAELRLLIVSAVAMPFVASAVAVLGFRRARTLVARIVKLGGPETTSQTDALVRARFVARIVSIAAKRGPVRTSCLRSSLLLWGLLRREGIEATLKIGVAREADGLRAHAWVEHHGRPLNDTDDVGSRFRAFEQDLGDSEPSPA